MDTRTGEIFESTPEEFEQKKKELGEALTELGNLPKPDCPICRGRGHTGKPLKIGKKKKSCWRYQPCPCTNPIQ